MAGELDTEHIEYFTLQPISGEMHPYRGCGAVAVGDGGLNSHALVTRKTIDDINQVEPLGALGPIYGGDIDQVIEIRFQLEEFQYRNGGIGFCDYEILSQIS